MLEALAQDFRQAFRHLRRSPGFAAAAILTLAFGVGANTAMFSMLNALVWRQLPISDPRGLIAVSSVSPQEQLRPTPVRALGELARDGPFTNVCAYLGGSVVAVDVEGTATNSVAALVSGRCFAVFGVQPIIGRVITDQDAPLLGRGAPVAVIGYRLWQRAFGGRADVIGKTIRTEGAELTVVGVMPDGFGGLHADVGSEVFTPFDSVLAWPPDRLSVATHFLGRLRPGVSLEQASAQLAARWPALVAAVMPATPSAAERADLGRLRVRVERIGTGLSFYRDRYARPLTLIAALTMVLLLLACANLGGLLLSRLTVRGAELAVRVALGGSRVRIAQQMLVESLVLSLAGAALAVPLAFAVVHVLASFLPPAAIERTVTFMPDLRALGVTMAVGVSAGVLMSALPIWMASRRRSPGHFTWDRTVVGSTSRWARALLVVQVSLSVVLLIGAGLLVRSLYLLQRVDLGVRADNVVMMRLMPRPNAYRDLDHASYYPRLLEQIAAVPGVRSAGYSRLFPRFVTDTLRTPIAWVGEPAGSVTATLETVSPDFFATVGIPLLAGRHTSWADNASAQQVALVSERLARDLAPEGNIIGRHVRFGADRLHQDVVIVGVVGNATLGNPRVPDPPVFYRPALQTGAYSNYPHFVVRLDVDVATVAADLRRIVDRGGREFVQEIAPLAEVFARAPAAERLGATLAGAIGVLALTLTFIGVYGLLAYAVSRRTREIGVRVALGADRGTVIRMVVGEGLRLTALGVAIGVPAALAMTRLLGMLMFGVSPADPLVFGGAAAFCLLLGVSAGIVPARRAIGVDPVVALRQC